LTNGYLPCYNGSIEEGISPESGGNGKLIEQPTGQKEMRYQYEEHNNESG
jgi:hypothetical protein